MNIYITDLTSICNHDDLINKLSADDLARYKSFLRPVRANQFLVAHTIKDEIADKFQYISIAHKNNFVIVAASNSPIGVDIEDTTQTRDFKAMTQFMNFENITSPTDFYRAFTLYEAKYKAAPHPALTPHFYKLNQYMICIVSNDQETVWENKLLIPEQI